MTLIELKNSLSNNVVPTDFMIFVNKESPFLASQYIQTIAKISDNGIRKIKSIYEPQQSSISLLTMPEGTINVVYVETFDERAEDYTQFENTIVMCEQIDKSIAKNVEAFVINFPKLEEWQILDYAKTICPDLEEPDILWLIQASNNSIERVINELEKAKMFSKEEQKSIFTSIRFDPQTDLFKVDLFTVVNALVDGDMAILFDFIKHNGYELIEPVMLANRVLTSLKNILLVTQNPGITHEVCGMSIGQFNFIAKKYRSINIETIRSKIKFLTNFDLALKTSCLDLSKRDMLNYLISHLYNKIVL